MSKRSALLQETVNRANDYFKHSEASQKQGRKTLQGFVESLLMAHNSYRGFNYLYWREQGCEEWRKAGSPENQCDKDVFIYGPSGDDTRIEMY